MDHKMSDLNASFSNVSSIIYVKKNFILYKRVIQINKVDFAKELTVRSTVYSCTLFKKNYVMDPFMFQKTGGMISFNMRIDVKIIKNIT